MVKYKVLPASVTLEFLSTNEGKQTQNIRLL